METIVHGMHCPNCGNSHFEFISGTLNHYVCTMCGSELEMLSADQSYRNVTPESLKDRAFIELNNRQFYDAIITFNKLIDRAPKYSRAYFGKYLAENESIDEQDLYSQDIIEKYIGAFNSDGEYSQTMTLESLKNTILNNNNLKIAYDLATPVDKNYYDAVITNIFEKALPIYNHRKYEHSKRLFEKHIAQKEAERKKTISQIDNNTSISELEILKKMFLDLGDYGDASFYAKKCRKRILILKRRKIQSRVSLILLVLGLIISHGLFVYQIIFYNPANYDFVSNFIISMIVNAVSVTFRIVFKHEEDIIENSILWKECMDDNSVFGVCTTIFAPFLFFIENSILIIISSSSLFDTIVDLLFVLTVITLLIGLLYKITSVISNVIHRIKKRIKKRDMCDDNNFVFEWLFFSPYYVLCLFFKFVRNTTEKMVYLKERKP